MFSVSVSLTVCPPPAKLVSEVPETSVGANAEDVHDQEFSGSCCAGFDDTPAGALDPEEDQMKSDSADIGDRYPCIVLSRVHSVK